MWFQSLEPSDNVTWPELQNLFRQRIFQNWVIHENNYSMHGDHLISFENTENKDSYVMQIRQVAALLGYGETTGIGRIQEYTSNKSVLDTTSNRRPKTRQ